MIRRVVCVAVLVALALLVGAPAQGLGCWWCQSSPSGWGMCRIAPGDGYRDCTTVVVDPFNGTTNCDFGQSDYCGDAAGGGGGGGGGEWWCAPFCWMYY